MTANQDLMAQAKACADSVCDLSRASIRAIKRFLDLASKGVDIPTDVRMAYSELWLNAQYALVADNFPSLSNLFGNVEERMLKLEERCAGMEYSPLCIVCRRIVEIVQSRFEEVCNAATVVELSRRGDVGSRVELSRAGRLDFTVSMKIVNEYGSLAPDLENLKIELGGNDVLRRGKIGCGAESEFSVSVPVTESAWNVGEMECDFRIAFEGYGRSECQNRLIKIPISCRIEEDKLSLYGEREADGDRFVGRETSLLAVKSAFSKNKYNSGFLITGQRRSGKSSFLKQVGKCLAGENYVHIRISLYGDNKIGKNSMAKSPFSRIFDQVETKMGLPDGHEDDESTRFDRIVEILQKDHRTYVLAIDEYQNLYDDYSTAAKSERDAVDEVAKKLRWLMTQGCCHLLIVAQDYISEYRNLMNVFAPLTPIRMTYFSEEETRELAAKMDPAIVPGFRRLGDEAVNWLYRLTGGHPFFAQKICAYLVAWFFQTGTYRLDASEHEKIEWKFLDPDSVYDPVLRPEDFESFYELRLPSCMDGETGGFVAEQMLHDFYFGIAKGDAPSNCFDGAPWLNEMRMRGIIVRAYEGVGYVLRTKIFSKWLAVRNVEEYPVERFLMEDRHE